jgi:hypothetical protein
MLDVSIIEPVLAVSLLVASARKLPRRGRVLERVFSGEYGLRGRHGTLLRALGERETSSGKRGSEMVQLGNTSLWLMGKTIIRRTGQRIGSSFSPQDAETTKTKMSAEKVDMQETGGMNFLPRFLRADGLFRIWTRSTDSLATRLNLGKKLHAHAICWAGSSIVTHIHHIQKVCVCVCVCV